MVGAPGIERAVTSPMRAPLVVAMLSATFAAAACSHPPAIPRDDPALGDDAANGASSKKSAASSDSPEGTSTELGPGTKGTDPSPEPSRAEGDDSTSSAAPSTCTMDAQCNQAGRICTAGACVKGCRDDASCPTNQVCAGGQCDLANSKVECYFDYDCALGAICTTGACTPGCNTSYDCPTGQTCASGTCQATTTPPPGGTACSSDGQCNPGVNGSGQICSPQGSCIAGCHRDNQCPGTKICVTGTCR